MRYETCTCGVEIAVCGMSSHLRGRFHQAAKRKMDLRADGWYPVRAYHTGKMVERLGINGFWDVLNAFPGGPGKSGRYTYAYYVREAVAKVVNSNRPLAERKRQLKETVQDPISCM